MASDYSDDLSYTSADEYANVPDPAVLGVALILAAVSAYFMGRLARRLFRN